MGWEEGGHQGWGGGCKFWFLAPVLLPITSCALFGLCPTLSLPKHQPSEQGCR